jgi:hypothetical protein
MASPISSLGTPAQALDYTEGAKDDLSNLTNPTSVNQDLIPSAPGKFLGDLTAPWAGLFTIGTLAAQADGSENAMAAYDGLTLNYKNFFTVTSAMAGNPATGVIDSAVTGTTQAPGTNTAQLATTSFVQTAIGGSGFVPSARTITIAGTANQITSSAGAQDLSANRTWTLSLPNALTFTGKTITGGAYSGASATTFTFTTGTIGTAVTGVTQVAGTNNTTLATTAFVQGNFANNLLNNLSFPTSVNQQLNPAGDKALPLGSDTHRWGLLYSIGATSGMTDNFTLEVYDTGIGNYQAAFTMTVGNPATAQLASFVTVTTPAPLTSNTTLANTQYVDLAVAASAATSAPVGATYITQTPNGTLTGEQAMSTLATGIVKNTTATGVQSIAVQGTDYYAPGGTDVALADGGTSASLVASNGGLVYSTAGAMAILAGTATAGQIPRSGANSAPSWSTATYPATTTVNRLLYSSAANVISDLATANSGLLVTDGSGVPSISTTIPNGVVATTQSSNDASTKLATTLYVDNVTPPLTFGESVVNIVCCIPGAFSSTFSTNLAQTINMNTQIYFVPFYLQSNLTTTSIGTYIVTGLAASTVTLGIYAAQSNSTGLPNGAALGAVSMASTAQGAVSGALAVALVKNKLYYAAIQVSSNVTLAVQVALKNLHPGSYNTVTAGTGYVPSTIAYTNAYSAGTLPSVTPGSVAGIQKQYEPVIVLL